ncbi:hypothetical protein [Synechococcus sp. MIT S1220]|uniref:hypothetical protein n=1 Tax=Synechococcus sp. MIT S1220 TaxID=3082549 RepID=UPI0039B0EDA4
MTEIKLGGSSPAFDKTITHILDKLRPQRVIELGCGQGKLGKLLSQSKILPNEYLIGVQPLAQEFDADTLKGYGYTQIINESIDNFLKLHIDLSTDMYIAMDVLEHLPFSEMISTVDQLLYHCELMLIIHPSKHPQNAGDNLLDAHRTSFELIDLAQRFEIIYYNLTGFAQISSIHRYHFTLLRGHMNLKTVPALI